MIKIIATEWRNLDGMGVEALREIKPEAEFATLTALLALEARVKTTLTGKRHGRTYRVPETGAYYVASAPGEPPARMLGKLAQSVGHSQPKWSGWTVSGKVGPGLGQPPSGGVDPARAYARRLEYGGSDKRGVMIEARPYMEPSVKKAMPAMDRAFRKVGSR